MLIRTEQMLHELHLNNIIRETEAHCLDMQFNVAKSMILRVGCSYDVVCAKLSIGGCELQFVCKLKYLGVHLLLLFSVYLCLPVCLLLMW